MSKQLRITEQLSLLKALSPYNPKPNCNSVPVDMIRSVLTDIIKVYPILNEVYLYITNKPEGLFYTVSFGGIESKEAKIAGFTFEDIKHAKKTIKENGLKYNYYCDEEEFVEIIYNDR